MPTCPQHCAPGKGRWQVRMGGVPAPLALRRLVPSSQWGHPSSRAAPRPEISGQMPTALSHPCQPHTRPAHCHLISAPKRGPLWQPVDSILGRLLFSLGMAGECAGQMDSRSGARWAPPPARPQSGPLSALLTCPPSGKGGQRRQGRGGVKEEAPS